MLKSRQGAVAGIVAAAALIPLAGAAGAHVSSASESATAQNRVLLVYNCKHGKFKPPTVLLACADAGFRVRGIQWSSWTTREARGRGTGIVNDCKPSCGQGTFHRYPVRLRAFRPRDTGGCVPGSLFTRLTWSFPGRKPEGPRTGTESLICP